MNAFAFVEIRYLFKEYRLPDGRLHAALHDLHLDVEAGEFAVVLGPSGCGKTTLLNLLGRLDTEYRGIIRMPSARIGFVFQEPRLLPVGMQQ